MAAKPRSKAQQAATRKLIAANRKRRNAAAPNPTKKKITKRPARSAWLIWGKIANGYVYYAGKGMLFNTDLKAATKFERRRDAETIRQRLIAHAKLDDRQLRIGNTFSRRFAHKPNPVPPSSKARIKEAARRFEDFTGHPPEHIDLLDVPDVDTAFGIGHCDGVLYTCVRDGVVEHYVHKFKKKARPLLASSFDGRQLLLLSGGYQFTDRGIVDD